MSPVRVQRSPIEAGVRLSVAAPVTGDRVPLLHGHHEGDGEVAFTRPLGQRYVLVGRKILLADS
jgi:hypothetical protein